MYADLAGRYSDIKADSLTNEDGTIRWNIENKDFYKAFFEHILRPHENIGVDFWWVDWQQWMITQPTPTMKDKRPIFCLQFFIVEKHMIQPKSIT